MKALADREELIRTGKLTTIIFIRDFNSKVTYKHTYVHTYIHKYMHTYIHTYKKIYAPTTVHNAHSIDRNFLTVLFTLTYKTSILLLRFLEPNF